VLNANLLGPLDVDSGFYKAVSQRDPDIIIIQELNPTVAERLSSQLGASYPCKAVEPKPGVLGMGVFSKFPCTKRGVSKLRPGIGIPQIVDVQLPDQKTVGVINVHTIPPHVLTKHNPDDNEVQQLSNSIIGRELFVEEIIKASREVNTDAAIIAGDFNATARNRVYQIVRKMGYFDAFAVGSRLRGGTWPGTQFPLPSWLVRIDFIFHCAGLQAIEAETLPDGYRSDHRGVFAKLGFVN
jgi:endonuclease/exonuclease/phosphatase (EEP) superfamily protein YafD